MTDRPIIFLDIDGPMIPAGAYFMDKNASYNRTYSPVCVAILKRLLRVSNGLIVTNSTHNADHTAIEGGRLLRDSLIAAGLPVDAFPEAWKTAYPSPPGDYKESRRMRAIDDWMGRHPEYTRWIAFDDDKFTNDERLIHIDPYIGITARDYNRAADLLNFEPFNVML